MLTTGTGSGNRAERRAKDYGHPAEEPRLVSAAELASQWGVTRATIYNLLKRGLPSVSIGRCRRFRIAEAEDWLEAQQR